MVFWLKILGDKANYVDSQFKKHPVLSFWSLQYACL